MEMLDDEVRGHLYEVVEGAASVDDFEAWFVARTWDERTILVAQLDHLLAERSLLDETELVEQRRRLARTIAYTDVSVARTTSATAETLRPRAIHVGGNETIRGRLELAGT